MSDCDRTARAGLERPRPRRTGHRQPSPARRPLRCNGHLQLLFERTHEVAPRHTCTYITLAAAAAVAPALRLSPFAAPTNEPPPAPRRLRAREKESELSDKVTEMPPAPRACRQSPRASHPAAEARSTDRCARTPTRRTQRRRSGEGGHAASNQRSPRVV